MSHWNNGEEGVGCQSRRTVGYIGYGYIDFKCLKLHGDDDDFNINVTSIFFLCYLWSFCS